ncbi:unnamed protein product, partial [Adineta steineri]
LRTEDIGFLCYFHFYIVDSSKELEKEFFKFKKQYSESTIEFYRIFKTTSEQTKNRQYNIGSLILTNEYYQQLVIMINATNQGLDFASEYVEYQKAKMTDSDIMLMSGHSIIETEICCIYYNMGRIYRLKGEYGRALEYLDQAYTTHSKAGPARLVNAAKAMNAMGTFRKEQDNIPQAIGSFESALKTYGKTLQASHPDVVGVLINFRNIYCEQKEFTVALSCFNRARRIYDRNLPSNHPNITILLNNIGNLYQQQSQLDLALNAYQRALAIYENILPPNHPDIVRNQHNISKIYIMLGDQKNRNFQLKQATQCDLDIKNPFPEPMRTIRSLSDTMDMSNISDSNMKFIEMINF